MLDAMRATNRSKVARFAQVVDAIPAAPVGALLYWCHWVLCCCAEPKHTQQEAAHSEQAAGRSIVWCLPRGGPWAALPCDAAGAPQSHARAVSACMHVCGVLAGPRCCCCYSLPAPLTPLTPDSHLALASFVAARALIVCLPPRLHSHDTHSTHPKCPLTELS